MEFLFKRIFEKFRPVSREAVVRALNNQSPISNNPQETEKAKFLAKALKSGWEQAQSSALWKVEAVPKQLDRVISMCPKLWEAYIVRGYAYDGMVWPDWGGSFFGSSTNDVKRFVAEQTAKTTRYRKFAMRDYSRACSKLKNTEIAGELFKLSDFESRLGDLRGAWSCNTCGRWYRELQREAGCPYDSCRKR